MYNKYKPLHYYELRTLSGLMVLEDVSEDAIIRDFLRHVMQHLSSPTTRMPDHPFSAQRVEVRSALSNMLTAGIAVEVSLELRRERETLL